jgi:hypothetical protein
MDWKAELDRERRKRGLVTEAASSAAADLDETQEQHALRERALRAAEPYIRDVRRQVFGDPDPPWKPTQYRQAVKWIRDRLQKEEKAGIKGSGKTLRLPQHEFMVPDRSSLAALTRAVERVHVGTGFPESHVVGWILSGEEPDLPRVRITVTDAMATLGERRLERRTVTLQFNTPIREADFRRLFRQVRTAFKSGDVGSPLARGREGPVLTPLDRHLAGIIERRPDATWEERAASWVSDPPPGMSKEEWRTSRHALVTPDALRVRWARYQDKLAKITETED